MVKFLIGLAVVIIIAGTLAKRFFPQHVRQIGPKVSGPVRRVFVQIAGVLVVASAIAIGVHFWRSLPDAQPATAMPGFSFKASDITGATFARDFGPFGLTDHTGQKRALADFKGKVVLVFFGYTQCPDVCPTAMQRFVEVFRALGPQAARVQVLFVSVDPERDTREILAGYVPWFDKSFLGLSTTPELTAAMAKEFRVFYAKRKSEGALDYSVDHWAGAYAYDPMGRLRLYIPPDLSSADVAHDIAALLR
jgi:protein SCO1/2